MLKTVTKSLALTAAVMMAASVGTGCSSTPKTNAGAYTAGTVRINTNALAKATDISKVTATVYESNGTTVVAGPKDLTGSGTTYTGSITNVTPGARVVKIEAFDTATPTPNVIYRGEGPTTITAGNVTTVVITLQDVTSAPAATHIPVIDSVSFQSPITITAGVPGPTQQLLTTSHDPDAGDMLTYQWTDTCSGTLSASNVASPNWTAPTSPGTCNLTFRVQDNHSNSAAIAFSIVVNTSATTGDVSVSVNVNQAPSLSLSAIIDLGTTTTTGTLTLTAVDQDSPADALNPPTWSTNCAGLLSGGQPLSASTSMTPGFTMPAPSAFCTVTATVSDARGGTNSASLVLGQNCGTPCAAGSSCSPTGACSAACTPNCSGKVCGDDGCGGTCGTCTAPNTCDATGQCVSPVCVPQCTGKVCGPDGCGSTCAPGCTGTNTCDATGQCIAAANGNPTPALSKAINLIDFKGLAMDTSGASYVAGPVVGTTTVDGISVAAAGSADAIVAKFDPTTRAAVWAKNFGGGAAEGSAPTDQFPSGVAVTQDGTVVVVGTSNGNIVKDAINVAIPGTQDFIIGLNGSTGAGVWGRTYNNGLGGLLNAVAANPSLNVFAVCGWTNQESTLAMAASEVAPGGTTVTFGGGSITAPRDVVIAMFRSNGALIWAKQLGSASDEECDSLAIDDSGDLYVAGKYNTVTGQTAGFNPGGGALPSTTSANRRHLWVAKYSGATGAFAAQASFGIPAGGCSPVTACNGNHTPNSVAVDASKNVVLGGSFTFTLPFGGTSLTSGGGADAFVAKLDPALTPVWAVRMGGPVDDVVNSVAVTSFGEVLTTGYFFGSTTGAATLTNGDAALATTDAFLLKLDPATGAAQFQAAYGDATNNQVGVSVAANRLGQGTVKDLFEFGGTYAGQFAFPPLTATLPLSGKSFIVFAPFQ